MSKSHMPRRGELDVAPVPASVESRVKGLETAYVRLTERFDAGYRDLLQKVTLRDQHKPVTVSEREQHRVRIEALEGNLRHLGRALQDTAAENAWLKASLADLRNEIRTPKPSLWKRIFP